MHETPALQITSAILETPLGRMMAGEINGKICWLLFAEQKGLSAMIKEVTTALSVDVVEGSSPVLESLQLELNEYFAGKRTEFTIPVHFIGTSFQQSVWLRLMTIPYGHSKSYLELAHLLGNKSAIRAVAAANGKNKILLLVPCHRVVGLHGSMTGYSGGVRRKQQLLELEQSIAKVGQVSMQF